MQPARLPAIIPQFSREQERRLEELRKKRAIPAPFAVVAGDGGLDEEALLAEAESRELHELESIYATFIQRSLVNMQLDAQRSSSSSGGGGGGTLSWLGRAFENTKKSSSWFPSWSTDGSSPSLTTSTGHRSDEGTTEIPSAPESSRGSVTTAASTTTAIDVPSVLVVGPPAPPTPTAAPPFSSGGLSSAGGGMVHRHARTASTSLAGLVAAAPNTSLFSRTAHASPAPFYIPKARGSGGDLTSADVGGDDVDDCDGDRMATTPFGSRSSTRPPASLAINVPTAAGEVESRSAVINDVREGAGGWLVGSSFSTSSVAPAATPTAALKMLKLRYTSAWLVLGVIVAVVLVVTAFDEFAADARLLSPILTSSSSASSSVATAPAVAAALCRIAINAVQAGATLLTISFIVRLLVGSPTSGQQQGGVSSGNVGGGDRWSPQLLDPAVHRTMDTLFLCLAIWQAAIHGALLRKYVSLYIGVGDAGNHDSHIVSNHGGGGDNDDLGQLALVTVRCLSNLLLAALHRRLAVWIAAG